MNQTKFTLRCERITADKPNLKGNIYPRSVLEQMVEQARPRVDGRRLLGRLGTSADPVRISDASHIVTDIALDDDGHLKAEIEVMATPQGKELRKLLNSSGPSSMEIIPCGMGSTTKLDEATRRINDDYVLKTFDIVPRLDQNLACGAGVIAQRSKTIRIPLIVDEHGNTFAQAWAHKDCEPHQEDTDAMIEQARELHDASFPYSQTVVVRWVTIQVPLPEPEGEVPGTIQAEEGE